MKHEDTQVLVVNMPLIILCLLNCLTSLGTGFFLFFFFPFLKWLAKLQAKSGPLPIFIIKFYWHTAILIHIHLIFDAFTLQ